MSKTLYYGWDNNEDNYLYLTYSPKDFDNFKSAYLENVSLEKLADFLDQEAESSNQHSFVGVHRGLATLLYLNLGKENTKLILFKIAELGGLMEMGELGVLTELGVKKCWHDFELPKND
jgi:hypothetical protein